MPKFDRKKYSSELKKRVKESHENKDQGLFGGSIFKPGTEIKIWKCGEGKHYVDVIPYIAGRFNPRVKEGAPAHNLDIWVHYNIGPNGSPFICLAKNYNDPCPICDYRKSLDTEDEELLKSFLPKRRTLYNIICRDNEKEEDKGIQVWDVAHFFFEQKVAAIAERPRSGGFINWPDPDEGELVRFERKGSGASNTQFLGHAFDKREVEITDEQLAEAVCLDEIIYIPEYEEIDAILKGHARKEKAEEPPDDPDDRPSRRGRERDEEKTDAKDDASERPSRRRRQEPEKKACPGELGKDIDSFKECEECKMYDECADEADRLEEEKKAKTGKKITRR